MGRRYKQAGYQDSDKSGAQTGKPRRAQGSPAPRKREGPRGRGLGKPTRTVFRCARCGLDQDLSTDMSYEATCGGCGSDLRTCTNCRYFDSSAPKECRQPDVDHIMKKATRNNCEEFSPKTSQVSEPDRGGAEDPKNAFDALFDF